MSISLTQMYVRDDINFLTSSIGNETVIMNMNNGNYVGLNTVASDIWQLLEKPNSLQGIVSELMKVYNVLEGECRAQSEECLNIMLAQNMITKHS